MEKTKEIRADRFAFYIGGQDTCLSCKIRKQEILKLETMLPEVKFYEMNATEVREFLLEQKILKIPFFMITFKGKVLDIFYTYQSIIALYIRLKELIDRSAD